MCVNDSCISIIDIIRYYCLFSVFACFEYKMHILYPYIQIDRQIDIVEYNILSIYIYLYICLVLASNASSSSTRVSMPSGTLLEFVRPSWVYECLVQQRLVLNTIIYHTISMHTSDDLYIYILIYIYQYRILDIFSLMRIYICVPKFLRSLLVPGWGSGYVDRTRSGYPVGTSQ